MRLAEIEQSLCPAFATTSGKEKLFLKYLVNEGIDMNMLRASYAEGERAALQAVIGKAIIGALARVTH